MRKFLSSSSALVLLSLLISCSNESNQNQDIAKMFNKSYIESASTKEKLEYKNFISPNGLLINIIIFEFNKLINYEKISINSFDIFYFYILQS